MKEFDPHNPWLVTIGGGVAVLLVGLGINFFVTERTPSQTEVPSTATTPLKQNVTYTLTANNTYQLENGYDFKLFWAEVQTNDVQHTVLKYSFLGTGLNTRGEVDPTTGTIVFNSCNGSSRNEEYPELRVVFSEAPGVGQEVIHTRYRLTDCP